MGKDSEDKRRRRQRRNQRKADAGTSPRASKAARVLASYSISSVSALLDAASVSPKAAHCGSAIAYLFSTSAQRRGSPAEVVPADALPRLISAAYADQPSLAQGDDFQPYDGREEVLVRWGSGLFRMLAGSLERPTALVNQHALLASVIDRVLVPLVGFGLGDAGELVLRRIDAAARSILPQSPTGPQAEIRDVPQLTEPEVRSAIELASFPVIASDCSDPVRAKLALERFTVEPSNLLLEPAMGVVSRFGTALAIRLADKVLAIPTGFLPETLPAIGAELARLAVEHDQTLDRDFAVLIAQRALLLLRATGQKTAGPMVAAGNGSVFLLVEFNEGRILFLNLIAGLTDARVQKLLDAGADLLRNVKAGASLSTKNAEIELPNYAEIVRLQVIARPQSATPMAVSGPFITFEDLDWVLRTSLKNIDDIWFFARDLARSHGGPMMFAFDIIDKWQVWKQQKGFYRGGMPPPGFVFAPHAAVEEWKEASERSLIEAALHALNLPALRDWPLVDLTNEKRADVADPGRSRALHILASPLPAAISRACPSPPDLSDEFLWNLAGGIAWKLQHVQSAMVAAAAKSNVISIHIEFEFVQRDSGPPLTGKLARNGWLTIEFDARLPKELSADSLEVERLCGILLSSLFRAEFRDEIVQAWTEAPPGVRVDGLFIRQKSRELPAPFHPREAVGYAIKRQLSEYLASERVAVGVRAGADAIAFESQTVFPWLVARFHEAIASLSGGELMEFAADQLERANCHRIMLDRRIGWERGFPERGDSDTTAERAVISHLIRTVFFVIEEALAHPPSGTAAVRESDWIDALSIADLCIDSCFRSDAIHQRLSNSAIAISDLYEIDTCPAGGLADVDIDAYSARRAETELPEPVPISPASRLPPEPGSVGIPLLESRPELKLVDQAMRTHMGFGLEHVVSLLNLAIDWDTTNNAPVALTDRGSLVDRCTALIERDEHTEVEAALDYMLLTGASLAETVIPHWETERREKRVATSPFLSVSDMIYIMPWTAESTLRIFANYVEDGRLPWPNRVLPAAVVNAFNKFRQKRNRDLEKECANILRKLPFKVIGSLKPDKAKKHGVSKLHGEIDVLCMDASRSRCWVIEAKDPYISYSAYQIRRLVDDFEDPDNYVDKLLQKVNDITESVDAIALALDLVPAAGAWSVYGLVVTRRVEAAAFVRTPRVRYCLLNDVAQLLDQQELPPLGFFDPT
jgi:hypothetical protein